MRKLLFIPLMFLVNLCFSADMVLQITIPSACVARGTAAFSNLAGRSMFMGNGELMAQVNFGYSPQQGKETTKQFTQRAVACLVYNMIRLSELNNDTIRFKVQNEALPKPSVNVPPDIALPQ